MKVIFKITAVFSIVFALIGCDPGPDGYSGWSSPDRDCRYGNCHHYPSYDDRNYDYDGRHHNSHYGYDGRDHDYHYDDDYRDHHPRNNYDSDHDRCGRSPRDNNSHHTSQSIQPPPPPPPPREQIIRPSCPPNTTFDGHSCIVPEKDRRKGGKGTVNACPSNMWLSGDRCVPNNH